MRYVQFAEEEIPMEITLLVALEGGGFNKCGTTDLCVSCKALYFSAASEETQFIVPKIFTC